MCVHCLSFHVIPNLAVCRWLSHDVNSLKVSKYITNTSKSKYSPYLIGCKNAYIEMRLFAIEIDKSKN